MGVRVILGDIQSARARQIAAEIGNGARAVEIDTSSEASIEAAFATVDELHGLVNAAGILERVPLLKIVSADFDKIIAVNLRGYILCAREAAKKIIATGTPGSIVNICSVSAHHGYRQLICYGASKGGVLAATRAMAVELGEYAIRVNSVSPGVMRTAINADRLQNPDQLAHSIGISQLGRIGEPSDAVGIVELLLSQRSSWMTGADVLLDGGERAGAR